MAKLTTHIPLGRVFTPDAVGTLLNELQEVLKPIPDLGIRYDPPLLGVAMDSILTITADGADLRRLERLARAYLRV